MAEFQRFQKPEKRKIVMYCDIFVYAHDLFIVVLPYMALGLLGGGVLLVIGHLFQIYHVDIHLCHKSSRSTPLLPLLICDLFFC